MQTISEYCKEKGILKADLARQLGVHPNYLTAWQAKGWMISDGMLWSPKHSLKIQRKKTCKA